MRITAEQWPVLSRLFDEAMELPREIRDSWLESLGTLDAGLKGKLRALLECHERIETSDFLDTLPKFQPAENAAADPTEPGALLAGTIVGPYVIEQEIGRGGMGVVWRARRADGLVKRPVALKLLRAGFPSSESLARFARERDILAALTHPNIARLYDAGSTAAGQPYLALEFVEGLALIEYCDRNRLGIRERLQLMLQVLGAVQFAHSHLVVHRDLKPSNILVTADGQVHLLDFGIAKLLAEELEGHTQITQFGGRALTPDYASPEQVQGRPLTTATDIYSLGVIFYELLAGERPYRLKRDTPRTLEQAILEGPPQKPSRAPSLELCAQHRAMTGRRLARMLRGDLDTIALKALNKEPERRYAGADAFAQDLIRFTCGDAVLAQRDSTWYRVRKFLLRNKLTAISGFAVVLALAVGLGVALWQADIARQQTRVAKSEAQTAQAVQAFLQDIFRANASDQADPLKARNTTARALLDIGAANIGGALNDAPAAKLGVLKTLGQMYDDLDLGDTEIALARQRVTIAQAAYGPNHPAVAEALVDLGAALTKFDPRVEVERVFRDATKILDDLGDFGSKTRAQLDVGLARYYIRTDLARSLRYAESGTKLLHAFPVTLQLVNALYIKTLICSATGDYACANAAAEEALLSAKELGSQANSLLPIIYAYLGRGQAGLGDMAAAEANLRQALEVSTRLQGEEANTTLGMAEELADFLLQSSRIAGALGVLDQAAKIAMRSAADGDTSATPSEVVFLYGEALVTSGRVEEGLATLREAESLIRKLGQRPDLSAPLFERQADGLIEIGRNTEALQLLSQALDFRLQVGQSGTPLLNRNVASRSRVMMMAGQNIQAESTFSSYLVPSQGAASISRPQLVQATIRAELQLAAGNAADAAALGADVQKLIAGSVSRPYFEIWEARAALTQGRALLKSRRAADALPPLMRAVALDAELYDRERSPELSDAQIALANCYLMLGQSDQAQVLLASAERIQATHRELGTQHTEPLRRLRARIASLHAARIEREVNR
jgi:eukaryotic-like serine/threonine-protein kinase